MFNNMKNKIREKTGGDLPKLVTSYTTLRKNIHSRQSSTSSLSSITSEQSWKDNVENNKTALLINSDSTKSISQVEETNTDGIKPANNDPISNNPINWENRLHEKQKDWEEKEKIYVSDLLKQTKELQAALSSVEESRKMYQRCQEEKEELDLYQKHEITRIKQLLLIKEEENNSNIAALKEALSSVESLKREVNRLRPIEEQVNDCQDDLECLRHTSEKERWNLTSQIAQHEETIRHLEERVSVLTYRTEAECQALGAQLSADERVHSLISERALLERRLEEAHIHLSEIKTSWSNKIAILETQVGRLSRQAGEEGVERRKAESRILELEHKIEETNEEKEVLKKMIDKLRRERDNLVQELKITTDNVNNDESDLKEKYDMLSRDYEELKERCSFLETKQKESENILEETLENEKEKNTEINIQMNLLKYDIEQVRNMLDEETDSKDKILFRNAQVSQQLQLTHHELKKKEVQNEELKKKISELEELLEMSQKAVDEQQQIQSKQSIASSAESELTDKLKSLETEVMVKNKSIKILQQNLTDMKKTLQEELKGSAPENGNNDISINPPSFADDINFKYMKHVLIKFLTCSEYEAQHLTRVVSTLLKLNSEEERLLRETLEWRMSWFGIRPRNKTRPHPS